MAPELLDPDKFGKRSSRPTKPADMYALGMVIYEVLTGLDPFHDGDVAGLSLIRLVVNGARPAKPRDAEKLGLGSRTWELVRKCWKRDSEGRPVIGLVLEHLVHVSGSPMEVDLASKIPRKSSDNPKKFGAARMVLSNCKKICLLARGLTRPPPSIIPMYNSPSSTGLPLGILHSLCLVSHDQ